MWLYDNSKYFGTSSPIEYPDFLNEVFRVGGQTPLFKYVKLIASELVAFSVDGKESFTLNELASGVCSTIPGLYPSRIGNQMKKDIDKKISSVLVEGTNYELKDYIDWDKKNATGTLKKILPGCKAVNYKNFKDQANEMSERLRLNGPVPLKYINKRTNHDPNQLELDLVFEVDDPGA